jgi:murein DD-endopeptidase MepM/ murein hydrolase activator NlpD
MKPGWTVQILPHSAGGPSRNFQVRKRTVRLVVAGALLALLAAGVGFFLLARGAWRSAELSRLRSENRTLLASVRDIQGRMDALTRSMDDFSNREERFRLTAGLPLLDPDVRAVGVGGPPLADPTRQALLRLDPGAAGETGDVSSVLDVLLRRARLLNSSLAEATDSLRVHRAVMVARPSIRPVPADESWISSGFSRSRYHPILLYNRPHEGLDLSAPLGAPIRAAAPGTVTFAGKDEGYGNMVEIDHGYGYRTRYAHASRILVRRGQHVERGQVVARVGETGLATGPNLHYEILVHGHHVDPKPYLLGDHLFE